MSAESSTDLGVSALMASDLEASIVEDISPLLGMFTASSTPKRGSAKPDEESCGDSTRSQVMESS